MLNIRRVVLGESATLYQPNDTAVVPTKYGSVTVELPDSGAAKPEKFVPTAGGTR